MADEPRTVIYGDGQVLLDIADPSTYVALDDEGVQTTFLAPDAPAG